MARFIQAKRLKFMSDDGKIDGAGHIQIAPTTYLELNPTTHLILHPTQNLVASPEGTFIIRTAASLDGDLKVGGALTVAGSLIFTGTATHKGDNFFGDDPADVHTFIGNINASSDMALYGDFWTKGNASLDGTLDVAGDVVFNASQHTKGNASLDGDLILAGNLWEKGNASIDGTLTVTGNSNLQNASVESKFQAMGGGNVITRRKIIVNYSDFSETASVENIKLILASIGDTIYDVFAKLATPFKYDNGPATVLGSIYRLSVGDMSNLLGYNATQLCGSSVSAPSLLFATQSGLGGKNSYLWNASGCRIPKVYTANGSIEARFTASGGTFLASLTQGRIYFYIDSIQSP